MKKYRYAFLSLAIFFSWLPPWLQPRSSAQDSRVYRGLKPTTEHILAGTGDAKGAVAFSPDGSNLLVGDDAGRVFRYDGPTGKLIDNFVVRADYAPIHALAFHPDGRGFAVATPDRAPGNLAEPSVGDAVSIRDAEGPEIRRLPPMPGRIIALAFNADGDQIAAMDHTYQVRAWRRSDGIEVFASETPRADVRPAPSPASRVNFSADLSRAVILNGVEQELDGAPWNHAIRLWEVGARQHRIIAMLEGFPIQSVAISRDGSTVLSSNETNLTLFYDFKTGIRTNLRQAVPREHAPPLSLSPTFLALSADQRRLVEGSRSGFVSVDKLDVAGGSYVFEGPRGYVRAAAFIRGGVRLASGGWEQLHERTIEGKVIRSFELITIWDVEVEGM